jgi:chromosome partitioning protein
MKVISFINMKGGVAKTTLAINIADCLSRQHAASVLCVDIDPQFNATQCLMDPDAYVSHVQQGGSTIINVFDRSRRARVGVVDGTTNEEPRPLDSIEPILVRERLELLPGALDLYRLEMAPGDGRENRLRIFLERVAEDKYDYVIIDTPPTPSIWMTSALIASQYYVIPVRPDPISLTGIDLLRNIVQEKTENFGLSIKCAGVVLTVVETNTLVYTNAVSSLSQNRIWKDQLFHQHLAKRTEVARLQLNQELILDSDNQELKLALASITRELLERIGG